jgi:hypothetical protein
MAHTNELFVVDDVGAQAGESVRGVDDGDVGVKILVRVLVVVVLAGDLHANTLRDLRARRKGEAGQSSFLGSSSLSGEIALSTARDG